MGAWGAGLYSSDFALDLRSTIAAVARLPLSRAEILTIVRDTAQRAADEPRDVEHTTFWFVLADQFQKREIACNDVTSKALSLIDCGADSLLLQQLGMSAEGLRKRSVKVAHLRERLQSGVASVRRKTLKKPQRFVMAIGDVLVFPTSRGASINPYFPADEKSRYGWVQDAWGAMLIADAGLAFGHLAWYTVMIAQNEFAERPAMSTLMVSPWTIRGSGTCSSTRFRRMDLNVVGRVAVNRETVKAAFGKL